MATFKISVWVDEDGTVFSKKMLEDVIKEKVAEELRSGRNFGDFICDDYTYFDLFSMNEEARAEIWKKYEAEARRWVEEEIEDCFDEQIIEIEVDIAS